METSLRFRIGMAVALSMFLTLSRVTGPFLKEILEEWAETNLVDQEQVSWFNSLIRMDNKPIFLKSGLK